MTEKIQNGAGQFLFRNLMQVFKCIMILLYSSAVSECTFSQLALIRTKIRNSLQIYARAAILTIKDALQNNVFNYETLSSKEFLSYLNGKTVEIFFKASGNAQKRRRKFSGVNS